MTAKKLFEFGGYTAAAILVAFGIAALVLGVNGRTEVRTDVKREQVVGEPDMNKTAILAEAKQAKLPASILATLPTCNVADKAVQVFGGYGYLDETRVSMHFRDARILRIGGGTDEVQLEILAKRMGL